VTSTRTALVTGASNGLGRVIALALGAHGYHLAVADLDLAGLADVRQEPSMQGRRVVPVGLDLRVQQSIDAGFRYALDSLGQIDVLVNNAAVALLKPAVEVTWSEWDAVVDVNLKGAFFMAQTFGRYCLERGRPGVIVNMASTHGLVALPDRSVYGITKGGLIQMTRMLGVEWADRDIRVNAIAPATVLTPSRASMLNDPEKRGKMLSRIPSGRFPTADEVAGAVLYLASSEAASVTGHTLVLDGGLTAY